MLWLKFHMLPAHVCGSLNGYDNTERTVGMKPACKKDCRHAFRPPHRAKNADRVVLG